MRDLWVRSSRLVLGRAVGLRALALLLAVAACIVAATPLVAQPPAGARAQYVLLVSIDGGRPDGLRAAGAGSLIQEGSYSMTAQTTIPPVTAPTHMSMVSGVGSEKHGVHDNSWVPGRPFPAASTIFSVGKRAGLRTALFTQKPYVRVIADPQHMDRVELVPWRVATLTPDLVAAASAYIRSARPHIILAHISETDAVGHADGWMSFGYLQSLRRALSGVESLRQALRDAGIEAQTLVIVTADHGGIDKDHVVIVPEVMTIPWIALGAGVKKGHAIEQPVRVFDTAATILHALGLAIPDGWDGRPVLEVFAARYPTHCALSGSQAPLAVQARTGSNHAAVSLYPASDDGSMPTSIASRR